MRILRHPGPEVSPPGPVPCATQRHARSRSSVTATSSAAATAAQSSSPGGRARGTADPITRPQLGHWPASPGTNAAHSPQRISTGAQRDEVVMAGQRSNQLRM